MAKESSRNIDGGAEQDPTIPRFEVNSIYNKQGKKVQATVGTKFGYFSLTGEDFKPAKGQNVATAPTQEEMRMLFETEEYRHLVKIVHRPDGYKAPWEK